MKPLAMRFARTATDLSRRDGYREMQPGIGLFRARGRNVRLLHYLTVRPWNFVNLYPVLGERAPSKFSIRWHIDRFG